MHAMKTETMLAECWSLCPAANRDGFQAVADKMRAAGKDDLTINEELERLLERGTATGKWPEVK